MRWRGAGDITLSVGQGLALAKVAREADTFDQALLSAVKDVLAAGMTVLRIEDEEDEQDSAG